MFCEVVGGIVATRYLKGVKKVRSTVQHIASNHLEKEVMLKIIFSMSLSFLVILYSIWHRV